LLARRDIGMVSGILVALLVLGADFDGLTVAGQRSLAVSLFGVVWWAAGVVQPGYTSLLMLVGWVLLKAAPAEVVFSLWSSPLVYLVIGGFLIGAAVQDSGLGQRISYHFILKYVNSFTGVIVSAYVLGVLLSFFIPHPFPRVFLIMSVMSVIIKSAGLPGPDAANIGLAVFASAAGGSMILLTGDSTMNVLASTIGARSLTWLDWVKHMSVPGIVATAATCLLQLKLFKPSVPFVLDKAPIRQRLRELGPLTGTEKRAAFWVGLAVLLWATDSLHHIHPGWVAALIVVGLSLPRVGDVLTPSSFTQVPVGTLLFLTAAMAIGKVGEVSGMNNWVATSVLPASVPANPWVFALLATAASIAVHMVLGSVMAVYGIVAPTLLLYAAPAGWDPMVPSLLVYSALYMHWILPFHQMTILIGVGEAGGGYTGREATRLGIPLTIFVFVVTVLVEIPWWKLTGLL